MSTNIVMEFLASLRRTRTGHRSSASAIYWRTAAAIAAGTRPKDKETDIAEALEKLGRDEDALAADAQRIAKLMQNERAAAKEADAKTRLKTATTAQADADRRAAELLREADRIRAEAQAATNEARNEVDIARGAAQRADALRLELARLGHPDYFGEDEKRQRQREIERLEAELRGIAEDLRSRAADVEALPIIDASQVEANRAGRARGRLALIEERRDRLVRRLESLKAGAPLEVDTEEADDIDDAEPLPEEVGRG
jgi:hypothetical protein